MAAPEAKYAVSDCILILFLILGCYVIQTYVNIVINHPYRPTVTPSCGYIYNLSLIIYIIIFSHGPESFAAFRQPAIEITLIYNDLNLHLRSHNEILFYRAMLC